MRHDENEVSKMKWEGSYKRKVQEFNTIVNYDEPIQHRTSTHLYLKI